MLRQTTVFILLVFSSTSWAQTIFDVHFNFEHSLRSENYFVHIKAERRGQDYKINLVTKDMFQNKNGNKVRHKTTKDTTFKISKETFDSLVDACKGISCSDVLADTGKSGLDGTTCEIYFGDWASSVSYKVWAPDNMTEKRHLTSFLNACKLILTASGLRPDKIL